VEPQVASPQAAPMLDESMFQQILEAAYVIQEQNERRRPARPTLDPAATLDAIVEAQEMLRSQAHDLPAAAHIIVEHLERITNAAGVAMAVIHGDHLEYCAASGTAAGLAGSSGPIGSNLSEFLHEEQALHRFQSASQWSADLLRRHEASCPIFFPVYYQDTIAGLLQLSFPETESIQDHEVRSCQVMAGLMGEAIGRAAELEWKQTLAAERASMLEALEQLRPQLERLAVEPPATIEEAEESQEPASPAAEPIPFPTSELENKPEGSPVCKQCGYQFGEGEIFCGRCGTPRSVELALAPTAFPDAPVSEPLQETLAAESVPVEEPAVAEDSFPEEASLPEEVQQALIHFSSEAVPQTDGSSALAISSEAEVSDEAAPEEQAGKPEIVVSTPTPELAPSPWGSATKALRWLKSLEAEEAPSRIWLVRHHGDLAVALSVIVLLFVLTGWGSHSLSSKAGQPKLTLFEQLLVNVGLAEAPTVPVYNGNPNVSVWVDLHTALYYCPGADLYGKTPDGKFTSQRDAQMDHFEPAARKNCD